MKIQSIHDKSFFLNHTGLNSFIKYYFIIIPEYNNLIDYNINITALKKLPRMLTFVLLVFLSALNCSSYNTDLEKWEGISESNLRVTISEFFPFEENITSDNIKQQIKDRLDQRASLLLASHISINIPRNKISHETDIFINDQMNSTIAGGVVLRYDCTENNYCTAEAEYNIAELQKKLELINNP